MKDLIRKFILAVVCLEMVFSTMGTYAGPEKKIRLYTVDGRNQTFPESKVAAQLSVGWYIEPVQRLYAEGKSKIFPKAKVAKQLAVGWYIEPVQRLYAEGKSKLFPKSKVVEQLAVGWYIEPVRRLYAPDGSSKLFPESKVVAQVSVGWKLQPVEKKGNLDDILKGDFSSIVGKWVSASGANYYIDEHYSEKKYGNDWVSCVVNITKNSNGTYEWNVITDFSDGSGESHFVRVYPAGVEMISPWNGKVIPTDKSRMRIEAGHESVSKAEDVMYKVQ